jgi:AraC-like DNA-binding protein
MGEERTGALRTRVAAALGQQALSDRELARRAGVDIHTVTRLLYEDYGISRRSAAKVTGALGMTLATATAPLACRACRDMPPAGYRCLACGAETIAGAAVVTDELARLTLVTYEPRAARIMADRKYQVGLVLGEFYCTRAYLWPVADKWPNPREAEQVTFRRLRDARRGLRERLAERGPWWTA